MSETNKYNHSKIYKIWSPSRDDLVYYGSTYQSLSQRMSIHRSHYRQFKEGKIRKVMSFKIFEECDDSRIELVENYPCSNKEELNSREGYYIRNNNCVNKVVPCRTRSEYYEDNREKINEYREANREKINEKRKKYEEEHREEINKKAKEYRETNREKINEGHKKYYQEHKEEAKEYREANREKINARRRELRKLKKEDNPQ